MDINIINSWDFNTPAPGHGEGQGDTNTLTEEEVWIAWEEIRNWTQQIHSDIKEIQSDF